MGAPKRFEAFAHVLSYTVFFRLLHLANLREYLFFLKPGFTPLALVFNRGASQRVLPKPCTRPDLWGCVKFFCYKPCLAEAASTG